MPVIVYSKSGASLGIYTKEKGHNLPHVTVKWAGKKMILFFNGKSPITRDSWSPRELREINEAFEIYRDVLLDTWELIHGEI